MPFETSKIHQQIDSCMRADQHRMRQQLRRLSKLQQQNKLKPDALQRLLSDVEKSTARLQRRRENLPVPEYPSDLPVVQAREEILQAIKQHQVVIICGETGSGKTTQIPKMCLELGRGINGTIAHTQPRRIAARTVAMRIASELKSELGQTVGYKIRFSDKTSENSYIKLMTDGIILAEIQNDPYLNQYDTLIIDEAHERSLNIDFLLGYLKHLLPRRRDLKLIVTSATIDPQRFSKHFSDAPVIFAEGRSYPVEVRYRPPDELDEDPQNQQDGPVLFRACEELASSNSGDILVFLPGEREIRENTDYLRRHLSQSKRLRGTDVLPLFGRLSNAEQNVIFSAHTKRRIVLATNVAETSLTVPGIRCVIDFGYARISRYSVRSKVQRLPIEKISQASANQRKGRCGREADGICIRLYSQEDFDGRPEFTDPEILRTNLASVILQMEVMGIGHVENFPFIEKPEGKYINDGYKLLQELGAVDDKRKLSNMGRLLARMPIDPRLARMVYAAKEEGCVAEILTIVSALSVQDPRERPMDKQQAADEQHAEFNDDKSDFNSWLNLWEFLHVQSDRLSNSQFRKMCRQRFLAYMRIREWRDVRSQLVRTLKDSGFIESATVASYEKIHRALLSGLLANVAVKEEKSNYLGTRNRKLKIFPGSALFKSGPKWMIAEEVSETTRLYARTVAAIELEWVEHQADHLMKKSYYSASWQRKRAQVGAYQRSSLYGLEINPKKRVNYGPINSVESREIFIRDALVAGNYSTQASFYHHNLKLLDEVKDLEEKSRRRDIVIDPMDMFIFYDKIIPEGIYSGPLFEKWRKNYEQETPKGLFFDRQLLVHEDAPDVRLADFPDQLEFSGIVLPLSYHFSPGEINDGVTLSVPLGVLNRVSATQCEWLVPGLLKEKIDALLRSLPKSLRRNFVPVPDYAKACVEALEADDSSLYQAVTYLLKRMTGVEVSLDSWKPDALDLHLQMNFRLLDKSGKEVEQGRDLLALQKRYADHIEESFSKNTNNTFERNNIVDWNFGDLPESVELKTAGVIMQGFPALRVEGDEIALRLFASKVKAEHEMQRGLSALYAKLLHDEVKYMRRQLPDIQLLCLRFAPFGSCDVLVKDIVRAAVDQNFVLGRDHPKTREQFYLILEQQRGQLLPHATQLCETLAIIFESYRGISKRLDGSLSLSWIEPAMDIRDQLAGLIYKGFVSATPKLWLSRIPAYMKAIDKRLDSIDHEPDKDRRRRGEFLPLWERYKMLPNTRDTDELYEEKHIRLRWLLEELRVSIFAQSVRTHEKVSIKRLESLIKELK